MWFPGDLPDSSPPDADPRLPLDVPFTSEQAGEYGVSRKVLGRLVRAGVLRRVFRNVYVDSAAPDDLKCRAQALSLVLPDSAVVTDETAAWLHGAALLAANEHVAPGGLKVFRVPSGTRIRRAGCEGGERMLHPRDVERVGGVWVTTPLRTACDLGRLRRPDRAFAALDAMMRVGGFDRRQLVDELPRFKGMRGIVQLRALAPLADGRAESPGESVLRLRWLEAGLPPATPQLPILSSMGNPVAFLDLGNEELRFATEYDGWDFHSTPEQRAHDERRRRRLRDRDGWRIVVLTKAEVFGPDRGLAGRILKRELAAHLRRPW